MREHAIIADSINKDYRLFSNKKNKLMELVRSKNRHVIMHALKDVSFILNKGESLGLLGLNGSGKSTLANIISGIVQPSSGDIQVNGNAASISVSVGLSQNLTGMENIEYKCMLLGFSPNAIKEMMPKIIEFADIGTYIDQPVKYYSSGMSARLGFAISINIDPDILVIDEGLSVGDPSFTDKCLYAMESFRERGKTVIFVSHALSTVKSFCSKALWLEYGGVRDFGEVNQVCNAYSDFMNKYNKLDSYERNIYKKVRLSAI